MMENLSEKEIKSILAAAIIQKALSTPEVENYLRSSMSAAVEKATGTYVRVDLYATYKELRAKGMTEAEAFASLQKIYEERVYIDHLKTLEE